MVNETRNDGQMEEQEQMQDEFDEVDQQAADDQDMQNEDSNLDMLLSFMLNSLDAAPVVPLSSGKRMVNPQVFYDIVKDIRDCLPDEIRYSKEILRRRDRIIRDAQASADSKIQAADARANAAIDDANRRAQSILHDAEDRETRIIEQAQQRARDMIEQSEIMRLAHEEAAHVCEEAKATASEERRKAHIYVDTLLKSLEEDVRSTLSAVQTSLQNFKGEAK